MKTDELRKLRAEATQGEWKQRQCAIAGQFSERDEVIGVVCKAFGGLVSSRQAENNARLVVAAVNHLDALLDVAETAKALTEYWREHHPILLQAEHGAPLAAALARLEQTK